MTATLPIYLLEQYTLKFPAEVLRVNATLDGEAETVVVFRGFSSSLTRATAPDPTVPVLPASATLNSIDRLQGPYQPDNPHYLERDIPWQRFRDRLAELGIA